MKTISGRKEFAYYYPGYEWGTNADSWIKSLLLFFDGIALLKPRQISDMYRDIDDYLATPLLEKGLLHFIEPESVIDEDITLALHKILEGLLSKGVFESLKTKCPIFDRIYRSRIGWAVYPWETHQIIKKFEKIGLATESSDEHTFTVTKEVRYLVLTLLSQLMRKKEDELGFALSPATDQFDVVHSINTLLNLSTLPSSGHVVSFDLQQVTVDLEDIPLNEVLSFRQDNIVAYRKYSIAVKRFVRELGMLSDEERTSALIERQTEIDDMASDLRNISRLAWKRPASFGLSISGAVWTAFSGDPLGALLALGSAAIGASSNEPRQAGVYSYLFAAHKNFA